MRSTLAALAAAGLALVSLGPVLGASFVGDDYEELYGATNDGPLATHNLHAGRNLRPLNQAVHDLLYKAVGLDPVPHHLASLALHLACAAMVGVVASALLRDRPDGERRLVATGAAVAFAVMPNHVEPVAWVSARSDLGMSLFLLIGLRCWLSRPAHRAPTTPAVPTTLATPAATAGATAGAVASFGIALAFNEAAIAFPLVVTALEASRPAATRAARARAAASSWPLYAATAVYVTVRLAVLGTVKSGSLWDEFVGDSLASLVKYSAALWVRTWLPSMPAGGWVAVAALAAAVGAAALVALRQRPPGRHLDPRRLPWQVWFLLAGPVAWIAPVGHLGASATGPNGERLVYFSSSLAAIALAWAVTVLARRSQRWGLVTGATLLVLALVAGRAGAETWREAGDLTGSIVHRLGELPPNRHLYLLATPDNVRDALAMRSVAAHALVLDHGWHNPPAVDELATYSAGRADAEVSVRPGTAPNRWIVRLGDGADGWFQLSGTDATWTVEGVSVRRVDDRTIEVEFPSDVDPQSLWYVSGGRLRPVAADR